MPSKNQMRDTGGFTLIEVLVAMVILAIGLMSLEALTIGSARSIAIADRQSGYATIASDSLEAAVHQLRAGTVPSQFCQSNLQFGDRLSRQIDVTNPRLPRVTVRVIPNPSSLNAPSSDFVLSSSVFVPVALGGGSGGSPCA